MQYKIPQNVGIEDKIVGPLTLRQLIIIAVGAGVTWVLFAIMSKLYELNILEYIIIALPALLSVAFALIRINDLSLLKYLLLMSEFSLKPKRRLWDHRGIVNLVAPDLTEAKAAAPSTVAAEALEKAKKASNLRQLSVVLDSGGFEHIKTPVHKDIDIIPDENLVTQAYFGSEDKSKMSMYWRSAESHKKRLEFFAKLPTTQLKKGTREVEMAMQEIAKAKAEAEAVRGQRPSFVPPSGTAAGRPVTNIPKPIPPKTPTSKSGIPKPAPPKTSQPPKPQTKPQPSFGTKPSSTSQAPKTPARSEQDRSGGQPKSPQAKSTPPPLKKPQPVRKDNVVNTMNKQAPAVYVPKKQESELRTKDSAGTQNLKPDQVKPQAKPEKPEAKSTGGEFKFEELKKGEIEINLD